MRRSAANPAALVADAMNAVIGVGAPWYTSGVHVWNGTAATLKPRPTSSSTIPATSVPVSNRVFSRQEVGDAGERGGAGGAVDERDAVQEDRRRERAEHEVLDAGFLRAQPATVERGEHVQRDRQDLEREEHDDQVVRGGHDDHAERRRRARGRGTRVLRAARASGTRPTPAARARSRSTTTIPRYTPKPSTRTMPRHRADRAVVTDVDPLPDQQPARRRALRRPRPRTRPSCAPGRCRMRARSSTISTAAPPSANSGAIASQLTCGVAMSLTTRDHLAALPVVGRRGPRSTPAMPGGFGSR